MNTLIYLGCSISYQNETDITVNASKFLQVTGIMNRTLKPSQVWKHTGLVIHNSLALPTLLYTCKTWAIREQNKSRIMSVEMKFISTMTKYTWLLGKTSADMSSEFKVHPFVKKIQITELNGYNMLGECTETDYTLNYEISTVWKMNPRMTPRKSSWLFMGPEQVTRPKTLHAIWWWWISEWFCLISQGYSPHRSALCHSSWQHC